jgi:hypothetical protein
MFDAMDVEPSAPREALPLDDYMVQIVYYKVIPNA